MAPQDDSRPAKRRRTDDGNDTLASLQRDSTKHQSLSDLYNPTMIKVIIHWKKNKVEQKEEFMVPRGLICSKSEYFDKVFRKGFKESRTGVVHLHDVIPFRFRVLIGWLYFSTIFYNRQRDEPTTFEEDVGTADKSDQRDGSEGNVDAMPQIGDSGLGKFDDKNHSAMREELQKLAQQDGRIHSQKQVEENESGKESTMQGKQQAQATQSRISDGCEEPDWSQPNGQGGVTTSSGPFAQPAAAEDPNASACEDPQEGNKESTSDCDQPTTKDSDVADDRSASVDDNDPITWPWGYLLGLYIFGDEYDTKGFRNAIIEVMQEKILHLYDTEVQTNLPGFYDIGRALQYLPISSPPLRLFVDHEQHTSIESLVRDMNGPDGVEIPGPYFMACFIKAQKQNAARQCRNCCFLRSRGKCLTVNHNAQDILNANEIDPCSYHEHGEDEEEKGLCRSKWEVIKDRILGKTDGDERDAGDEESDDYY